MPGYELCSMDMKFARFDLAVEILNKVSQT